MTTIYDIAKAAGVTAMTVSNVIRGKGSVSAATRERVMKYVQELGYQPNLVARSLSNGRTGVIGLVVPEMGNVFYSEATAIAERLAYARGMRIFVTTLSIEDKGAQLLNDLALRRVDGLIIASNSIAAQIIHSMSELHLPAVYCFWEADSQPVDYHVSFAFEEAGRLAAEHLLGLGHRRLGVVSYSHRLRFSGFKSALARHGVELPQEYICGGGSTPESGKIAGRKLLTLPERPTAIFATCDMVALGVMAAAWELGLRVPQDLSIVGHDDTELAAYATPPLTSIRIDKPAMLAASFDLLLAILADKKIVSPSPFPARLIVRSSSGPRPAGISD
ncbi:LacI family transcriptional regulator [Ktedonosporobacter rubrisoli]|uniref:LacI family transcriptional regulator n=1 Tax=Ktedonosporobacter rubrisoli TaxID=2509675 RepID=A0A4P6JQH6_KTERU|nr:LacI family DNA-binding transcriptional regulator [Ktedonosporobacter rubrisoli]QBD77513.1 LacI family transcriptional regulator [Ktedonosporobacter rubrisoli]